MLIITANYKAAMYTTIYNQIHVSAWKSAKVSNEKSLERMKMTMTLFYWSCLIRLRRNFSIIVEAVLDKIETKYHSMYALDQDWGRLTGLFWNCWYLYGCRAWFIHGLLMTGLHPYWCTAAHPSFMPGSVQAKKEGIASRQYPSQITAQSTGNLQ